MMEPDRNNRTEGIMMQLDYKNMTEEEAMEILHRDWPEYERETEQTIKDGDSLVEWLSILESFA